MNEKKYIISLDQGTTSSRVVIFDEKLNIIEKIQKEFIQIYPRPGWVEHDPLEIYASQYSVMTEAIAKSGINPSDIIGIGIANQRETTIVWNKKTGKPIYNAIVWQCRRTANIIEQIKKDGMEEYIITNTGLVLDAYFSATKIKWILDNVENAKELALKGDLLFGTIDTWLIWKLTNGKVFATDYTNASRTMLFNIKTLTWDKIICDYFGIPLAMLPVVKNSADDYGYTNIFGENIMICGVAGDQQAALFGQTCFNEGDLKNTYGTGCFLLMNTGKRLCHSKNGLLTTIAVSLKNEIHYALEGSVFVAGALVQWLRDEMRFIIDSRDSEYFALKEIDSNGVYVVPAFTGLGAPYWDMYARGSIFGITRGTNRNHIIRAALESIGYQTYDVVKAMENDTGIKINELRVDGGASNNNFIMQFQADILDCKIKRASIMETTALGVCFLVGLYKRRWRDLDEIKNNWRFEQEYISVMNKEERINRIKKWHKAIKKTRDWLKDEEEEKENI